MPFAVIINKCKLHKFRKIWWSLKRKSRTMALPLFNISELKVKKLGEGCSLSKLDFFNTEPLMEHAHFSFPFCFIWKNHFLINSVQMKAALSFQKRIELFQSRAGTQNTLLSHYHEIPSWAGALAKVKKERWAFIRIFYWKPILNHSHKNPI